MHSPQPGARLFGRLLRARRNALGLSREEVRRRSRGDIGRPLAPTVLRDLETGDRLPVLGRLPGLARALEFHPAELLEWAFLAPLLEDTESREPPLPGPRSAVLQAAARDLRAGRPELAAVRALSTWPDPRGPGAPPLVLAQAVLALDRPLLALFLAARAGGREGSLEIRAEALRRLGLTDLARRVLAGSVRAGTSAVGARLLEETDPLRAARAWAELLDRARAEGDERRAAEAAAGVARCLARAGRPREAERFRREGAGRPGPPGSLAPPRAGD